eukprot:CAMPEP_0197015712 /NCGR_PEP_ID=MMETSP1380-20130617/75318_1 /TAXON_ID=5936 /ORGANISM="Euplotes crassus, Strain CT5" /LENGTH=166 /DNA_ID=CAMNT_0042441849 /DNA_START=58 /DNA_END=557 /DNA_ORIENTATION=+
MTLQTTSTSLSSLMNLVMNNLITSTIKCCKMNFERTQLSPSKEQNIEISETRKKNDADDISEDSNFLKTVEEIVRSEIEAKGLDAVVQECSNHCFLGKSKPKNPKVKRYVRDRSDKTPLQVQAMVDALAPGQKQLVKSKRVKLGKKIGLSESQIYKWYYDTYSRAV